MTGRGLTAATADRYREPIALPLPGIHVKDAPAPSLDTLMRWIREELDRDAAPQPAESSTGPAREDEPPTRRSEDTRRG